MRKFNYFLQNRAAAGISVDTCRGAFYDGKIVGMPPATGDRCLLKRIRV